MQYKNPPQYFTILEGSPLDATGPITMQGLLRRTPCRVVQAASRLYAALALHPWAGERSGPILPKGPLTSQLSNNINTYEGPEDQRANKDQRDNKGQKPKGPTDLSAKGPRDHRDHKDHRDHRAKGPRPLAQGPKYSKDSRFI